MKIKFTALLSLALCITASCASEPREADMAEDDDASSADPRPAPAELVPAGDAPVPAETVPGADHLDENLADCAGELPAVSERRAPRSRDWCCMLETPSGTYNCHQWHTARVWAFAKCKGLGEFHSLPSRLVEGSCDSSACVTIDG